MEDVTVGTPEVISMRDGEGEVDGLGASPMELVDSIWAG